MLDFLRLFVHVLAAPSRTQAQLEAEITMLRLSLPRTRSGNIDDEVRRGSASRRCCQTAE
jgi:hypothetical protein